MSFGAVPLGAQSVMSGEVVGTVRDSLGRPLVEARVELTDLSSGFVRQAATSNDGAYAFAFLPAGSYDLRVEQLGFQPQLVRMVNVQPAAVTDVSVTLGRVELPVHEVAERMERPGEVADAAAGTRWELGRLELSGLPARRRDLAELGRYTSVLDDELGMEGLPGRLSALAIDGMLYRSAEHPGGVSDSRPAALFPLTSVGEATVLAGGVDVEWSEAPAGILHARGRRGSRQFQARLFGDWSGDLASGSKFFASDRVSHNTLRGGVLLSGPVVRDTAHFLLGVEAQRLELPQPPAWIARVSEGPLAEIAEDSFGVDLAPFREPRLLTSDVVSGFARFDWQAAERYRLSVRANGATFRTTNPDLGPGTVVGEGIGLEARDLSAAATFTSVFSPGFGIEVRAGVETSQREYLVPDRPATLFTAAPVAFGVDPVLPGTFERTSFRLTEATHIMLRRHRIKVGASASITSFDQTYAHGQAGEVVFGGPGQFAAATGSFAQLVGRQPLARFSTVQFAGFAQESWRPSPGVNVLLGLRFELERLPEGEVRVNDAWLARTGLSNDSLPSSFVKWSPRIGLAWDPGARRQWLVLIEAGVYQGLVAPGLFSELVTQAGALEARRGVGALGVWPGPPDSVAAPVLGPVVTLLGPEFRGPRSSRASFGLRGRLGSSTTLHLSATYRHTDFLPRRQDLNLQFRPSGQDQYGRQIFGTLRQLGSMLVPEPGTNRRFDDFDVVSALNADGFSNYVGLTARLERRFGRRVTFTASYTYSQTTDNWLTGSPGRVDLQLTPFPDSLDGRDWADGRSDFDVPHRLVLGAEVDFGSVRLSGLYHYRSGLPFTPGFRDGVDANGDGSYRNDPAFIDAEIDGVADLFSRWDCLRRGADAFAERNACQGPAIQTLDLRVVVGPVVLGYPVEFVLDAINLIEANVADRDRALYLLDPDAALVTDPATGTVSMPLVANPNFGRPTVRRGMGRLLRVGVRVNYE